MSYTVQVNARVVNLKLKNGKSKVFTKGQTAPLTDFDIPSVLFFAINAKPQILASLNGKRTERKKGRINVKNIDEALKITSKQINDEYMSSISILDDKGDAVAELPKEAKEELEKLTPDSEIEREKEDAKFKVQVNSKVAEKVK